MVDLKVDLTGPNERVVQTNSTREVDLQVDQTEDKHTGISPEKIDFRVHEMTKYWVTQKLPQIYTANHATFQILIRKITVQICGKFWVTQ